jgi:predicted DNA-binding WGR domain protein
MTPFQRRWEKGTRYYQVDVCQGLWGRWVLIKRWGQRGTALGQSRRVPRGSPAEALSLLGRIQQRRLQHGYCTIS